MLVKDTDDCEEGVEISKAAELVSPPGEVKDEIGEETELVPVEDEIIEGTALATYVVVAEFVPL